MFYLLVLSIFCPVGSAVARPHCGTSTFTPIPDGKSAINVEVTQLPARVQDNNGWLASEAKWVALSEKDAMTGLAKKRVILLRACTEARGHEIAQCSLDLALLRKQASGTLRLVKRVTLARGPVMRGEHMYQIGQLAVADIDGGGGLEIMATWSIEGVSHPAIGHQTDDFYGIFHPNSLMTLWTDRIGATGAGELEACTGQLQRADMNCDGRFDLQLTTNCTMAICRERPNPDCPKPTVAVSRSYWLPTTGKWKKQDATAQ